jgi:hypothetical protein
VDPAAVDTLVNADISAVSIGDNTDLIVREEVSVPRRCGAGQSRLRRGVAFMRDRSASRSARRCKPLIWASHDP